LICVENKADVVDENVIESKLIGSPLFCGHLEKLYNQGIVEFLAEKSVKIRRDLHPTLFLLSVKKRKCKFCFIWRNIFYRVQEEWNYLLCTSQIQFF